MALPSSGQLSIENIAGEFGGAKPHALSEYYDASSGIPSSGQIKISDFYGAASSIQATGGTVTDITVGGVDYRVHTFTSSGTFSVTNAGPTGEVEYLIVGGGGGGVGDAGGGGAGGYRSSVVGELSGRNSSAEPVLVVSPGNYTVTVGAGGDGIQTRTSPADNGEDSSFGAITALGGGGGGGRENGQPQDGGSGGGGGLRATYSAPQGEPGQGFDGGRSTDPNSFSSGGGGGAGENGGDSPSSPVGAGGPGGDGLPSSITGSLVYRAGGGAGAGRGAAVAPLPSLGGGGYYITSGTITPAEANTGGGGSSYNDSFGFSVGLLQGGSGIVIIRYPI